MKAALARGGRIAVADIPIPVAESGQLLLQISVCGICGSDLHAFEQRPPDADPIVYGHEFSARVVSSADATSPLAPGARVCAIPQADGELVGMSERFPGGYGEFVVVDADLVVPIPDDVSDEAAALTEPLAVGVHAVAAGRIAGVRQALVIGCGPIGLAVIAVLRAESDVRIVASDPSPARRGLAARVGAHEVVDPNVADPFALLRTHECADPVLRNESTDRDTVIFECVGIPGMMQQIFDNAPEAARVVIVGACIVPDSITPVTAMRKELEIGFVLGYRRSEFAHALDLIAAGRVDTGPFISGVVPLDKVEQAFDELRSGAEHQVKILVRPRAH